MHTQRQMGVGCPESDRSTAFSTASCELPQPAAGDTSASVVLRSVEAAFVQLKSFATLACASVRGDFFDVGESETVPWST